MDRLPIPPQDSTPSPPEGRPQPPPAPQGRQFRQIERDPEAEPPRARRRLDFDVMDLSPPTTANVEQIVAQNIERARAPPVARPIGLRATRERQQIAAAQPPAGTGTENVEPPELREQARRRRRERRGRERQNRLLG